ncbi:MAG TPA: hypothetical protein VJ927_10895 [Actinomycetota bacterium]|nr:hypothetical protein [Actinomycetota bacterium]
MNSTVLGERIACPTCGMHHPTLSRMKHHTETAHDNKRVIVLDDENTTIDLRDGLVRVRRI